MKLARVVEPFHLRFEEADVAPRMFLISGGIVLIFNM